MDIDTLEPGVDFVEAIKDAISKCDILVVIIGKRWLSITDATEQRRLDNPDDFVRVEVQAGLERDIRVIPVLVGGATMPRARDLPEALTKLARRHALELSDARWHADVGRLLELAEKRAAEAQQRAEAKILSLFAIGVVFLGTAFTLENLNAAAFFGYSSYLFFIGAFLYFVFRRPERRRKFGR